METKQSPHVSQPMPPKVNTSVQATGNQSVHPQVMTTPQPSVPQNLPQTERKPAGKKHAGVMLLTRTQLFMYIEGVERVVIYPFSVDVVRDLDIVNQQLLTEQLTAFVTKNNLPPASFFVVLGNATIFARQILSTDPLQKKKEEETFINTVPFEDLATQHIVMGPNTYLTAANKHFYESILKALAPHGFEMTLVLPEFLFAKEINLSHGLTADSANALLKKMPEQRGYNLLKKEIIHDDPTQPSEESKMKLQVKGGKSNRVFVLSGILFMLIGVLVVVYLWVQQQNEQITPPPTPPAAQPVVTEAPQPVVASEEAALATPSGALQEEAVQGAFTPTIRINYSPSNSIQANQLRTRLEEYGYRGVILIDTSSIVSTTRIIYHPSVPEDIRDIITGEATTLFGNISELESNQTSSDVIITIR